MPETTDPNCMTVGAVDFGLGHGPVAVRCTKTGQHDRCMCVVLLHNEPAGEIVEVDDQVMEIVDSAPKEWATDSTGLPELERAGEIIDFPDPDSNGSEG